MDQAGLESDITLKQINGVKDEAGPTVRSNDSRASITRLFDDWFKATAETAKYPR